MQLILNSYAMKLADETTIEEYGISNFTLMESAGRAIALGIEENFGKVKNKRFLIICGKGNNGGDGLVLARSLHSKGAFVEVCLVESEDNLKEDNFKNLQILKKFKEKDGAHLQISSCDFAGNTEADFIVDAILGTGLQKNLNSKISKIVSWINSQESKKISIDIPTGLSPDNGQIMGNAAKADFTFVIAALKPGLLLNEGISLSGKIKLLEIGIPSFVLTESMKDKPVFCASDSIIQKWLPKRNANSHKYNVGSVIAITGSRGFSGAAIMSALAIQRSGAGMIICACPENIQTILDQHLIEAITFPLSVDSDGLKEENLELLQEKLKKVTSVLIGCGLGREKNTLNLILRLLTSLNKPLVIDADALHALVNHTELISEYSKGKWILTPHLGEFKALIGEENFDPALKIEIVREYARKWNCILLLKGLPSIIAQPDGTVFINKSGNPALATAGTGDILAGLCAGFLSQGMSSAEAAISATYIGGKAADRFIREKDEKSMIATDLLTEIPYILKELSSIE